MIKARLSNIAVALATAVTLPFGMASCVADAGSHANGEVSGNVSMPLITTSGGRVYRLSNVAIDVDGPTAATLSVTNPSDVSLTATLQAGDYEADLSQWTLERADHEGVFAPVRATLVSPRVVAFSIFGG